MDDDSTTTEECYNGFGEAYNITSPSSSSSSPSYYDEIITKLQLQSMAEHEYSGIPQRHQQRKPQEEQKEETGNQKRNERKRILLVDDEPDHCLIYRMVLQDAGFECIPYTDSVKALKEFKPNHYDLVILDVKMPLLNGFELCKKIRELDRIVHIIFITALSEYYKDIRDQSYPQLRNTVYIQKPISNQELIEIANEMLATESAN
jgi:two-component system, OmpR family, response regulator ChvI